MCQKESQKQEQLALTDAQRVLALQEELEVLQEQVESLKRELCEKDEQLQQQEEELKLTNQELYDMNDELCVVYQSKHFTLEEAKELAQTILAGKQPIGESLAQLLSAIYGSPVEAGELEPEQLPQLEPSLSKKGELKEVISRFIRFGTQFNQLEARLLVLRTLSASLKT
jgi:chromosome segregation ATPase